MFSSILKDLEGDLLDYAEHSSLERAEDYCDTYFEDSFSPCIGQIFNPEGEMIRIGARGTKYIRHMQAIEHMIGARVREVKARLESERDQLETEANHGGGTRGDAERLDSIKGQLVELDRAIGRKATRNG